MPMKLWAKAGVMFFDLIPEELLIPKLFKEEFSHKDKPKVSQQMWMTRRDFLSQKFTTDWSQIPVIK